MNKIIALWAHPRSLSTAFERIFLEREDFEVLHEPFAYCRFGGQDADIPYKNLDLSHPRTYSGVKKLIVDARSKKHVFHKDMCYHCLADLLDDEAFLLDQENTFIIRNPAKAILSHADINPGMSDDAIGYEALYAVFKKVGSLTGRIPLVIDADHFVRFPKETLETYCSLVGVEFHESSLSWAPVVPKEWSVWKEWHTAAAQSSAIKEAETRYWSNFSDQRLSALLEKNMPFYEALLSHSFMR